MIKVTHGMIQISGEATIVLAELTVLIKGIRTMLSEEVGEEFADKAIADAGRFAYMSDEEVELETQKLDDKIKELMEDYYE